MNNTASEVCEDTLMCEKTGQVETQKAYLNESICNLESIIGQLQDKLESVLICENIVPAADEKNPDTLAPLAEDIRVCGKRVENVMGMISNILGRLEL